MRNHPAHSGHAGQSGIQAHSLGPDHPVRSYCIDNVERRVAHCFGVEIESRNDYDAHRNNVAILKSAERIADAVYADRESRDGGSDWIGCTVPPDSGYCVGLAGWESQFDTLDRAYNAIYADIVGKLQWIDQNGWGGAGGPTVCVGWWYNEGRLYLDISVKIDDRDDALDQAYSEGQIAIYDLAGKCDLDVDTECAARDELKIRADVAATAERVDNERYLVSYVFVDGWEVEQYTVCARTVIQADSVIRRYRGGWNGFQHRTVHAGLTVTGGFEGVLKSEARDDSAD